MAIIDPVAAALDIGGKLIERLWPNPADQDAAKLKLLELQRAGELAQISVNAEEAKSSSLFVAGWRPAIGWVCGTACAWNWVGLPVAKFLLAAAGHPLDIASADLGEMLPLLLGMLGLGALRTVEKTQGVAR